ncbi:MAG: DUF1385 domain-containing protein [Oscillospiraceae bacterium]|nr:DUF1385 domain-containing protein [Oscillospiraceae bacterium]
MGKNKEKKEKKEESVKGTVGGQAVLEGVMMKSKETIAIAVRRENGEIVKKTRPYQSKRDKHKILNIPVVRGFVNFIEMMAMSMSTLNESADMLGLAEAEEPPAEKEAKEEKKEKKEKKESSNLVLIASIIGTVLGLALSFGLFFFLPTFLGKQITEITGFKKGGWFISLVEMITRVAIFILYILLVSLLKDIKRTFQYHGAEHMCVFCYEAAEELTVENAKKYSRFHPRCGTSFMIVMMIIGFLVGMAIPDFTNEYFGFSSAAAFWLRLAAKLSVFPFIIGIGFEFIKYAGKHDSAIVKIISAPGLWIQRLTTKKPDDMQVEVAVVSLRAALKMDPAERQNENENENENENGDQEPCFENAD